jgi:CHAT domain-containing protein/Tfp pilus assembly protein PilF
MPLGFPAIPRPGFSARLASVLSILLIFAMLPSIAAAQDTSAHLNDLLAARATSQDSSAQVKQIEQQVANLNLDGAKLMVAGDYDGSLALLKQALEISEKNFGRDDPLTEMSLINLGRTYTNRGEYDQAISVLERAIKISEASPFDARAGMADAKHTLALAYDYQANYDRAQPLYEQALALYEGVFGSSSREVAQVLNNLANLYMEKADYDRAAQMLERSLAIRLKLYGPTHPLIAVVLNNLASVYEWQGNMPRAEETFKQAIAITEQNGRQESYGYAQLLNNLGAFYRKDDPKKARPLLERGLAIREKLFGPDDPDVANSLNNIALLDWQEGNAKKAEEELLRALTILQQKVGPAHPDVSRVMANLALLYSAEGETKRAVSLLMSGLDRSDRNLEIMLATGSEAQKRLYMAALTDATSAMVSLHINSDPDDPVAARLALTRILRRKGRVLDVMSGQFAAVEKSDIVGQALLFKLSHVRSQLSSLALQGPESESADQYQTRLNALQDQVQSLEKMITERVSAAGSGGLLTIEQVQQSIPKDAALVEMIQYRPMTIAKRSMPLWEAPHYAAYVLRPTGAPSWIDLGDAAKIDLAANRLRAALRNPRRDDFSTLARAMDDQVMKPIRGLLGDTRQLLISPDGMLNLVPFAALMDETNHYLVENYTISYLTSGRDLLRNRTKTPNKMGPVIVANPQFALATPANTSNGPTGGQRSGDFSGRFEPLEGTASEAKQVSDVLPGTKVFTGPDATETVIKSLKAPLILHIATHGFFLAAKSPTASAPSQSTRSAAIGPSALVKENPLLRSGLALSGANQLNDGHGDDGILTALEAAGLDLHGTQLVVLSACETGIGEVQNGEGVYGLRRALVLAGSESQMMSLWKVDDEATRDLMVDFYHQLQAGKSRANALRDVQLKLLKRQEYQRPFFWAGFILSGDSGPIANLSAGH